VASPTGFEPVFWP